MYFPSIYLTLLTLLPSFTHAQCGSCKSFIGALKSCESISHTPTNISAVDPQSHSMDGPTLRCMCTTKSNLKQMSNCISSACLDTYPAIQPSLLALEAWINVCQQPNEKQSIKGYESLPFNPMPCLGGLAASLTATDELGSVPTSALAALTSGLASLATTGLTALPTSGVAGASSSALAGSGGASSTLGYV